MDLEKDIQEIKERNKRVELDKAWETSATRRIFIALVTYIVAIIWLSLIHETGVALKAVVPVAGYLLSTVSLPSLRKLWENLRGRLE
jgi:hypothetical protein